MPVVPTYAVDKGFWYSIPGPLADRVAVGSMVRVPLGGRRVRGYVTEIDERPPERLRDIAQVSGRATVMSEGLLSALRWAAAHYVAPLGPTLDRAAPPNVPPAPPKEPAREGERVPNALSDAVDASTKTGNRPIVVLDPAPAGLVSLARDAIAAGVSVCVIVPTAREVAELAEHLTAAGVVPFSVTPDMAGKDVTTAWRHLRHVPTVLIGTPKVAAWPHARPTVVYVVEESRRAMKDRQTPTIAVRELILERSRNEPMSPVFVGPTPSAELMGSGPDVRRLGTGRLWPLVEVVDRRDDPPGFGLLGSVARQAIRAVAPRGAVFIYAHRRGYAAASRCVACRTLRTCARCGSRPDIGDACARCGADLGPCENCGGDRFEPLGAGVGRLIEEVRRIVADDMVGDMGSRRPVRVGTERDLVSLEDCDLAILVDADGLIRGSNYRAAEEALRIGARIAGSVRHGGRLMVQTSDPEHHAVKALRRADPMAFHEVELADRQMFGYPPAGQLLIIEGRGIEDPETRHAELVAVGANVVILGPAPVTDGTRWLIQGDDLDVFKAAIRPIMGKWRDAGATIRIDADPIDL